MRGESRSISTTVVSQQSRSISSCFIDTGVFFASYHERDSLHTDGTLLVLSATLGWFGRAYTSTYVLDEIITLVKAKIGGDMAVELAEYVIGSKRIEILKVDEESNDHDTKLGKTLHDAVERFKKHRGMRGLSFTDCTTIVLSEKMKIGCILSFDGNFQSFVPRLLGEGYRASLAQNEKEILYKAAKNLGIKL
ncbi:MAG: PIN domain-containing protein [archaeon]|nr:PIN domain-containing protein [archaeon]